MVETKVPDEIRSKNGRILGKGILDPKIVVKLHYIQGMTKGEIAKQFGVTPQAVGALLNRISNESIPGIYESAKTLVEARVSIPKIMEGLLADAAAILQEVKLNVAAEEGDWDKMSIEKRKLQLATMSEIRSQIREFRDMQREMFSLEKAEEFQEIVMQVIREEDPELEKKIIDRLKRAQPIRQILGENGRQ
jgi:transcriptional regulator with XRE-family HTH domain